MVDAASLDRQQRCLPPRPARTADDRSGDIVHGSQPAVWEYLLDTTTATQNFSHFDTPYCFVGHSHLPVIFQLNPGRRHAQLLIPDADQRLSLAPRAILNPGSVGQPRDRDPRAAYAIYDTQAATWEFHRVAYDVSSVQAHAQIDLPLRHPAPEAGVSEAHDLGTSPPGRRLRRANATKMEEEK
jgi:diadenosine tetraphosphatase ApaH/serine/threonine PP2A family protein phosphatase